MYACCVCCICCVKPLKIDSSEESSSLVTIPIALESISQTSRLTGSPAEATSSHYPTGSSTGIFEAAFRTEALPAKNAENASLQGQIANLGENHIER
jgi:hypothetical protein